MPSHTKENNFIYERRSLEELRQSEPILIPATVPDHGSQDMADQISDPGTETSYFNSGNLPEIANQKQNNQCLYYLADILPNHRAGGTKQPTCEFTLGTYAPPMRANSTGLVSQLSLGLFYRYKVQAEESYPCPESGLKSRSTSPIARKWDRVEYKCPSRNVNSKSLPALWHPLGYRVPSDMWEVGSREQLRECSRPSSC